MNAIIIEDENLAADRLEKMLRSTDETIEVVAKIDTVAKSLDWLKNNEHPDLIFLDIHLGDGKSFEIFEKIEVKSYIIFTTAYDEYAIKAFKYNSVDYLLKPIKRKDFIFAVEKFRKQFLSGGQQHNVSQVINQLNKKSYKNRFLVRQATLIKSIKTEDVAFAYTKDRSHFIKLNSGEDYPIDINLDELEEQLNPDEYFRVNRQFIIRYSAIDQAFAWFDNKIKLQVKPVAYEDIIISRLRATEFKKWLDK
ncbi:MAG: LytR/AlgR family response regulator transcription factor [Ilyomonas sp.]